MNEAFKALSDPTRRRILELLRAGDLAAGVIASHFTIGQPSVSRHLSVLKAADLVQATRDGQTIVYSLNTTVFQDLVGWFLERGTPQEEKS